MIKKTTSKKVLTNEKLHRSHQTKNIYYITHLLKNLPMFNKRFIEEKDIVGRGKDPKTKIYHGVLVNNFKNTRVDILCFNDPKVPPTVLIAWDTSYNHVQTIKQCLAGVAHILEVETLSNHVNSCINYAFRSALNGKDFCGDEKKSSAHLKKHDETFSPLWADQLRLDSEKTHQDFNNELLRIKSQINPVLNHSLKVMKDDSNKES